MARAWVRTCRAGYCNPRWTPSPPLTRQWGGIKKKGHCGNERADQLAREAVNNAAIRINTPPSWAVYKQALKTQIYEEWEQKWINDNACRMTKIFYPKPHSNKAKCILELK